MPIEIQQAATLPEAGTATLRLPRRAPGRKVLSGKERMFFTERLELLLKTGVPLHAALETLEAQAGGEDVRRVIADLREHVGAGLSFAQALGKQAEAFPPTYVNLVAAGEEGGFLPRVLMRLREMDEKREELRSTLRSAFTYPAFLSVFSFAVVIFVLAVVFPKFAEIFEMIHDQLPITTRFLMALSEGLRRYWALALAGGGLGAALVWRWAAAPPGAAALDRLKLRLPVIREIAVQFQLVQFMHVMSLSLGNGVPLLDALRSCRGIVTSPAFRRFLERLETQVNEGKGVASGFHEAEFLPALVPQMVSTGEESGSLALVMGRVADFYEREWRKKLSAFAKIVEPAMLLVMGVVVGLLVSSLILPIFKLSATVR